MIPKLLYARLTLGIATVMVCASAGMSDAQAVGFCSETADTLLEACKTDVAAQGAVGRAVCLNISSASSRGKCLDELAATESEDDQLCEDQHSLRLDACLKLGEGRYDPDVSPSRFDPPGRPSKPNPYFPMRVGNHWEFRSATQTNTVDVVNETKNIAGVICAVFRDLVFEGLLLHEATDDWYAAARDGSVWYFGEEVKNFEIFKGDKPVRPELVSTDGSFKTGRDGSKSGVIALASPKAGDVYLEEFSLAVAEDVTEILSTTYAYGRDADLDRLVPRGLAERLCPGDCVVTLNYSLLEPGVSARKYVARGIGVFLEVESTGEVVQLVGCNFDSRCSNLPTP